MVPEPFLPVLPGLSLIRNFGRTCKFNCLDDYWFLLKEIWRVHSSNIIRFKSSPAYKATIITGKFYFAAQKAVPITDSPFV